MLRKCMYLLGLWLAVLSSVTMTGCLIGDVEVTTTPEFWLDFVSAGLTECEDDKVWWVFLITRNSDEEQFVLVRQDADRRPASPVIEETSAVSWPRRGSALEYAEPGDGWIMASALAIARDGPSSKADIRFLIAPPESGDCERIQSDPAMIELRDTLLTHGWRADEQHPFLYRID